MADAPARSWLITYGVWGLSTLNRVEGLWLNCCPFLMDPLDWGPQHIELATQDLLRQAFFRWPGPGAEDLDPYARALESGQEVLIWCEPLLASCLAILWLLESLSSRGVDLSRAYLVLSPGRSNDRELFTPEVIHRAFEQRVPVGELIRPLIAIRRHLASDSSEVRADLSKLPSPVREWVAVTSDLEDFLPDERELDIIDELLLENLRKRTDHPQAIWSDYWPCAAPALNVDYWPKSHYFTVGRLWDRLLELSGIVPPMPRSEVDPRKTLVQAWFGGEATNSRAHFAITPAGRRVFRGTTDWLPRWSYSRWVGGRLVSCDRPLRRPVR